MDLIVWLASNVVGVRMQAQAYGQQLVTGIQAEPAVTLDQLQFADLMWDFIFFSCHLYNLPRFILKTSNSRTKRTNQFNAKA